VAVKFSNNGKTTLSSGITTSATSLTVVDGSLFPAITGSESFFLTLEDISGNVEIVKVTARSGNSLTVTRAQESTTARAFSAGDKAENRLTAAGLNSFVSDSGDTMTGDLSFGDNLKTTYGADDDLEIYHSSSDNHSYIYHKKLGTPGFPPSPSHLVIKAQSINIKDENGDNGFTSSASGAALLYQGANRISVNSSGSSVHGDLYVSGTANVNEVSLDDNEHIRLGTDNTMYLVTNGSQSYLHTGDPLFVRSNNLKLTNTGDNEYFTGVSGGAATIYYNDVAKLATTNTGVNITGAITADDGMTIDGGDVTVNGQYADNVFMVDYSSGRVGVNLGSGNTPSNALHINGTVQFSGAGSNSGYQTTVTTYSSSTTFYRANGDLSFVAGSQSYPKLTLTNSGTLTYDDKSVGTQSIVTTAPTSATGFPNGHVWYVVS